jgi:hypothetical protein
VEHIPTFKLAGTGFGSFIWRPGKAELICELYRFVQGFFHILGAAKRRSQPAIDR